MFTGIVKELGTITKIDVKKDITTWQIKSKMAATFELGASIMVHGVCLTVVETGSDFFVVNIVPETLSCTNLGAKVEGDKVHLEPSLKLQDALDGHFVLGHVDTTASLREIYDRDLYELEFNLPKIYQQYIVRKGSVAINGVSLTVADVESDTFTVALIPETLKRTTFTKLSKGDLVNIEIDMVARYLEHMVSKRV